MTFQGPTPPSTRNQGSGYPVHLRDAAPDPIQWAFLAAVHLLRVGRASLLVFRGDDRQMTVAASVGIDPDVVPTIRVPLGSGIAGLVAERDMAVIGDARGTAYISVPVHAARGVAGVLNLTDRLDGGNLTDEDLESARSIADHLGYLLQGAIDAGLDQRTGLPDRWAFEDVLQRELARSARTGDPFSLVGIRLGPIDEVVNRIGEATTTTAVRSIADALRAVVRRYDVLAWGGEGFILLCPGAADPRPIAQRMLAVARSATHVEETGIVIGIGWVRSPAEGTSAEALLAQATDRVQDAQTAI